MTDRFLVSSISELKHTFLRGKLGNCFQVSNDKLENMTEEKTEECINYI